MEPQNLRSYDEKTNVAKLKAPVNLPLRPGTNTAGKAVQIRVNQFKVVQVPTKDVYQYDVGTFTCSVLRIRVNLIADSHRQWC